MQHNRKKSISLGAIGLLTAVVCLLTWGCRNEAGDEQESVQQALHTKGAADDKSEPSSSRGNVLRGVDYTRLSPEKTTGFWVSPRFDGDGKWVAYRNRRGRGVFLSSINGNRHKVVDQHIQGKLWWDETYAFFCIRSAYGVEILRPGEGRLSPLTDQGSDKAQKACRFRSWEEPYGVVVHKGPYGRILNHSRRGTLHVAVGRDPPEPVTVHGAWGVRVDSSGRRVAYCSGSLRTPVLHVYDLPTTKRMRLGVGVHPAWSPDGKRLVFTRPTDYGRMGGLTVITAAELFVWEAERQQIEPLTFTPEIAEMEPVFSPDGKTLVFSDWRRGGIYKAEMGTGKRGAP